MEILKNRRWVLPFLNKASRILSLIRDHHLLLSTLLVCNSLANESLPIFLKRIAGDWVALLGSVILVVLVGEVIPSAIMTGKYQLQIASAITPFIQFLESILFLICYPLSLLLDCILGTRVQRYHLQYIRQVVEACSQKDIIKPGELKIIAAVMELRNKQVLQFSKPISSVCFIQPDEPFCKRMIRKLKVKEYSVVPIIEDDCVIGTFKSKDLLLLDESHYGSLITELIKVYPPLKVSEDTTMLDLLKQFQIYQTTVAFVIGEQLQGIISLNDLFNQILDDVYQDEDVHGTLRIDYQQQLSASQSIQTIY